MNCDDAFDVITSSQARASEHLQEHLSACRRCQQMFETLEPALALFATDSKLPQESSSSFEKTNWQDLGTSQLAIGNSVHVAEESAAQLTLGSSTNIRRKHGRRECHVVEFFGDQYHGHSERPDRSGWGSLGPLGDGFDRQPHGAARRCVVGAAR